MIPTLNLFHWGSSGTVTQYTREKGTISLKLKNSNGRIQLHELINEKIPSLRNKAKFQLNPYLFTGILQTMYLNSGFLIKSFPVFYGREIIEYSDSGVSTADWVMEDWANDYNFDYKTNHYNREKFMSDEVATHPDGWPRLHPLTRYLKENEKTKIHSEAKPLIVIIHGLAGGSHEPIIKSMAHDLSKVNKFKIVVLNTRGCARSKLTTKKLFYALATNDLRELITKLHEENNERKIYAVGFSFGATILANYLGEERESTPLSGACCLCNPWDLVLSTHKICDDFWSKHIFLKTITQFLVRTVEVNMNELQYSEGVDPAPEFPPSLEHPSYHVFTSENVARAKDFKSFVEFDRVYTAPCLGLQNPFDYYKISSSILRLPNIRVPTLIINSRDDPIIGNACIPIKQAQENEYVVLCETDIGGHLAYLDKDMGSWATQQIACYFDKLEEFIE